MKRIKRFSKIYLTKQKILLVIFLIIFLNTGFFGYYFTNRLGEVLLIAAEKELREVTTLVVSSNITQDRLKRIGYQELIVAHKNQAGEILDVDFKLEVAYEMLLDLKDTLDLAVLNIKNGIIPTKTKVIKNNLVIEVPFYAYTNNLVLMNLGPKVCVKVSILEYIRGSITTKITSYGINTVLVDVYLNLFITESILFPVNRENIVIEYNILLASKVIQGKIPSFYQGKYETNSGIINT